MIAGIDARDDITGAEWRAGSSFEVEFAAERRPGGATAVADARDRFLISLEFAASRAGPPKRGLIDGKGCNDVRVPILMDLELQRFPHALYRVSGPALMFTCDTGIPVDDQRFLRADNSVPAGFSGGSYSSTYIRAWDDLVADVDAGTTTYLDFLSTCSGVFGGRDIGAGFEGGLEPGDAVFARHHVEFSGRAPDKDRSLVLGFDTIQGLATDANDTVARVRDVSFGPFAARRCTGIARQQVRDALRLGLRSDLPFGIRDGLLELALVDPVLLGASPQACTSDDDCNPVAGNAAAYRQESGGPARGVRHRCRTRDPARAESFGTQAVEIIADLPADNICHVQLEARRVNVRPEMMEVVALDSETDAQESFLLSLPSLVPLTLVCQPGRAGAPPAAGSAPLDVFHGFPLTPAP